MSEVEDYPGPTKGHEEKMGHDKELAKADETMVRPPARPEGAGSRKNELEQQNARRRMKRIISMKVVQVNTDSESMPCVILQCPKGEEIAPRATVTTRPIFPEQEALVESADRVKVLGKGKPNISLGDAVDVQLI
jgi:hypothetical protein